MSRVVHFDLLADDVERAKSFYSKVFGWEFSKWDGPMDYWLIKTGDEGEPGIDGGLALRQEPGQKGMNTLNVNSVDDATATIEANGGTITVPKMAVPGVGWLAYASDPEGNPFGIMQFDPSAA